MSEKFQIIESTDEGVNHTIASLPFNRNSRIDNMVHWIYENVDLVSGESIEHDLNNRRLRIFRKLDDGSELEVLIAEFKDPSEGKESGKETTN